MSSSAVTGAPRLWLRLEGLVIFVIATLAYARAGQGWLAFALLFFVPDISFAAYLVGPRAGSWAYNVLHTYALSLALLMTCVLLLSFDLLPSGSAARHASTWAAAVALVWTAHIGFDRSLGYGLKYPSDFKDTHLGRL